ncbi:MAG: CBS domain-containing protein, partial [Candidatus Marinimicrobia bacterium]|nr:CBS domain-containing protein [Candidatus Neomarinimicrobiota bacterium]
QTSYTDEFPEKRNITAIVGNTVTLNAPRGYTAFVNAFVVRATRDIKIISDYERTLTLSTAQSFAVGDVITQAYSRARGVVEASTTNSTTVTMAIGDALAAVLMTAKQFNQEDFARFHPGGNLGRRLKLHVMDIMTPLDKVAVVSPKQSIKETVLLMTKKPQGAAIVSDDSKKLIGVITDGDLRRGFAQNGNINELMVIDVMNNKPIFIYSNARLQDAVTLMEDRISQISVLPVLDESDDKCVGLLRLHDIYQSKLI